MAAAQERRGAILRPRRNVVPCKQEEEDVEKVQQGEEDGEKGKLGILKFLEVQEPYQFITLVGQCLVLFFFSRFINQNIKLHSERPECLEFKFLYSRKSFSECNLNFRLVFWKLKKACEAKLEVKEAMLCQAFWASNYVV